MGPTRDRQDQLRRDLVADVAHELRTPVAILQAGHEALLDGVAEPTPAELTSLRDEVLRLARMVDDLQTLAAADAAALQLALRPADLAGIAAAGARRQVRHPQDAAGADPRHPPAGLAPRGPGRDGGRGRRQPGPPVRGGRPDPGPG